MLQGVSMSQKSNRKRNRRPLFAENTSRQHDQLARARAHHLAAKVGFIWREFTGPDIGIDAALELSSNRLADRGALQGYILLQVKGRATLIGSNRLTIDFTERNHQYWLIQRLPVVICAVAISPGSESVPSSTESAYWIDYQALEQGDGHELKPSGDDLKLSVPVAFLTDQQEKLIRLKDDTLQSLKCLRVWLERVLKRQPLVAAQRALVMADLLLQVGRPDRAREILKERPLWETRILDQDGRRDLEKKAAKAFRRLGEPSQIESSLAKAKVAPNDFAVAKPEDQGVVAILKYERALALWTQGCANGMVLQSRFLREAVNYLRARFQKPPNVSPGRTTVLTLGQEEALRTTGAIVNIQTWLSLEREEPPTHKELKALSEAIEPWDRAYKATPEAVRGVKYDHYLNALRALCRGWLAQHRGQGLGKAQRTFRRLTQLVDEKPDPAPLALTDMILIKAWLRLQQRKETEARAILECTKWYLETMEDVLLTWFHNRLAGKSGLKKWKSLLIRRDQNL
jgi:tetratricopeptide (TPR) repeat protein